MTSMTDEQKHALQKVVEHMWKDEERDHECNPRDNHIFVSVLGLQEILWRGSPRTVGQPTPEPPANTSDLHLVTD